MQNLLMVLFFQESTAPDAAAGAAATGLMIVWLAVVVLMIAAMWKVFDKAGALAGTLTGQYGGTAYASMAALQVARLQADAGKPDRARESLQWVIDQAPQQELKAIARVRLAGVLLDEKQYEEALKALAGDVPAVHATAVADRRGDVLAAQNKVEEARAAYAEALAKADAQHPLRQIIQLKLDALPSSGS